jgi:hypothetical protein
MQRRPVLTVGLTTTLLAAIAASVAIAGPTVVGKDGNTQAIDVVIPKNLSKTTFTPISLKVTTKTTTTTNPNGVPSPAVRAVVDFDKNAQLYTKGIPTCDAAKLQNTSTDAALAACGNAKISTAGSGNVLLPVGPKVFPVPVTITGFNGVPQGGKPVVLLHAYGAAPVQTTQVLVGKVLNYNKEGFGPRLDVEIPKLAGGAGALTDFTVTISKKYTFKGQKRSFVSAKCPNSKKLKARGTFTFSDGEALTAVDSQSCKQRK